MSNTSWIDVVVVAIGALQVVALAVIAALLRVRDRKPPEAAQELEAPLTIRTPVRVVRTDDDAS